MEATLNDTRPDIVPCWSCGGPIDGSAFCDTCKAVQPPGQRDHFSRLGLNVSFDIDPATLDEVYFSMQRKLHPDRFATHSPKEKAYSQQQATAINDAYETLKDPHGRADYMVHLKGTDVLPEGCNLINDQVLLIESMEMREALAESETPADVDIISARATEDIRVCIAQLSKLFANNDIEGACKLTTRLKYLKKLAQEAQAHRAKLI
ncbi:MAG: Fe-S protein assembly co-chaperone HscB [Rhodospirillaceae bacterium]|jgi:molecular chaperone HscB|nr:Fe-S protein assembly co-chaperone HscB [Rhodospirillaceae bacterium]MBT4219847.1 Fe-S protein assembly co-chaperone HscB [Rhodospirillaceae bacterium]MBT4464198.1 Fe-S protein assembly co-chaperone HscB [Rhodospirillaceae bacterium]MBT5012807.1 Fe-S protein assembly co-chaperone HscB [Rhodospirillaceae bacterium]MBT5309311.1 Fe-S protein assembly co-chaperone HscB [Rhodospirillaceae bacterium]